MHIKKVILTLFISLNISNTANAAREYVTPFTPEKVIVADGYLQIVMPTSAKVGDCADTRTIVVADTNKYFSSYLSLATTAFVSGKKLNVAIGDSCHASPQWPNISIMMLQN